MTRKSFRRIARTMLVFSMVMLAFNLLTLVGWLHRMPSRPFAGSLTATLMLACTVFMATQVVFWRKRLRRY